LLLNRSSAAANRPEVSNLSPAPLDDSDVPGHRDSGDEFPEVIAAAREEKSAPAPDDNAPTRSPQLPPNDGVSHVRLDPFVLNDGGDMLVPPIELPVDTLAVTPPYSPIVWAFAFAQTNTIAARNAAVTEIRIIMSEILTAFGPPLSLLFVVSIL
jgi:hypothetical protein